MPDIHQMLVSDRKRPPLTVNYTKSPVKEHMPAKKQKMKKLSSYKISEELTVVPNFRKDVEDYHAPIFMSD